MSTARFKIRNLTTAGAWSPSTDAGFDCAAGDVLELQLEDSPALDIWITEYACTDKSNGRTAPVFDPVTGIAATPTSGVSITMPAAEVGTWAIRSMTNSGGDGSEEETAQHVFTRYVAVRTVNLDLRHPLAGETTQYLDPGGWAVALQEMIDEVDAGAAGAVPPGRILTAGAGLTGGGDLSADRTFDVVVNADGGLIVTANEMQLGALGFARVQTALALASSSIDVNAQKIVDLLDPTNPQDAATKAYVDGVAGGLDALTAVLENAAVALNANGVPIQAMGDTLLFIANGVTAVSFASDEASAAVIDSTYATTGSIEYVAEIIRRTSDLAVANIGGGLLFRVESAGGNANETAMVAPRLTDVTNAAEDAELTLWVISAGTLTERAVLSDAGLWTTDGAMQTDAGFDRSTAGALPIGGAVATSVVVGSNGTAANIDHRVATSGSSRWYVNNVLQATLAAAAFTWSEGLSAPVFGVDARTSDAATTTVEITGQTPWASATGTNRNAGSVRARIPSPTAGGAEGFFYVTISGADVARIGRPSGTFEAEVRFSPAATVLRPATISSSTVELFSGGLVFSTTNFNWRDQSQVLRVTRNITTAITDTYDASVTAITEAWTTDASAAGGTWTRTGQRGASGFAGGSLALNVGDGGTLGTNAPGNFDVGLGTAVSSVTGKQRWMTVAGTAVIAQIGLAAGAYALLEGGAAATAGLQIASTAELILCGGGSSDVTIKTGGIAGTTQATITTALASFTNRVEAPRFVGSGATPTSTANALTISLDTQNPEHTTTEATTVTISGGTRFQTGTIMFSQGASGYTVTMPTNGVGVEYDDAIAALTVTGIVDATALTRTLLSYRVLASGKAYIYARSVNTIP